MAGLNAKVARKVPLISKKQATKRLQWAKKHRRWSVAKWKAVIFSDEKIFQLFNQGRMYVRMKQTDQLTTRNTNPNVNHPLWGCFSWYGPGKTFI